MEYFTSLKRHREKKKKFKSVAIASVAVELYIVIYTVILKIYVSVPRHLILRVAAFVVWKKK